jgi:hypothetical protein
VNSTYLSKLRETLPGVINTLTRKGIEDRHLEFGGEGKPTKKKITVPTDARSEFLANRAMGDWAEQSLSQALRLAFPDWKVVQYGNTDRIAAGHPEFKARYLAGVEETRCFGKRPDLLVLPGSVNAPGDISELSHDDRSAFVNETLASIEVRSSKFEALTYMRVRQQQREAGNKTARETPSFTVKVEDLIIVYRWLEHYGVMQSYCQVFFDSIFAINFLDIFSTIASGSGFSIETPAKSQEKATIMIPITAGTKIGSATELPRFEAEHRVTELGRHDAFVVPCGGGFSLDAEAVRRVLLPGVV